jgi:hypothetical protein
MMLHLKTTNNNYLKITINVDDEYPINFVIVNTNKEVADVNIADSFTFIRRRRQRKLGELIAHVVEYVDAIVNLNENKTHLQYPKVSFWKMLS